MSRELNFLDLSQRTPFGSKSRYMLGNYVRQANLQDKSDTTKIHLFDIAYHLSKDESSCSKRHQGDTISSEHDAILCEYETN